MSAENQISPQKLNREDLELETDPPRSTKDIVFEEYFGFSQTYTDHNGTKHIYPKIEESLDGANSTILIKTQKVA